MKVDLFNLSYDRPEVILFYFLPALINLGIFLYVIRSFNQNRISTWFSLLVIGLFLWQLSEGFMHINVSAAGAETWRKLSTIFFLFVIPIGIQFVLCYSGLVNKTRVCLTALIFLPSLFFMILIEGGYDAYELKFSERWRWIANARPNFMNAILFSYLILGALAVLFILLFDILKKRTAEAARMDSISLMLGLSVPVAGGIVAEALFPLVLKIDNVPVTTVLVSTFSFSSLLAIKKYKLLDFRPVNEWENIIESMNEALLIVDNDDRIMYANQSFCETMEYEFQEIKGKIAHELFIDAEERSKIELAISERKKNKAGQYEIRMKTKSGKYVFVLISGASFRDSRGRVIGSIGIQTNITRQKEYEKSLEQSERRLNQAQSVGQMGSWELNFASGKSKWSEEACRIYGIPYSECEMDGPESWFRFIYPEDLALVKQEIEKARTTFSDHTIKHRIVRRDGKVRHINSSARFDFDAQGRPIGVFGICQDITEMEENAKALNEGRDKMQFFINESLLAIYFVDPYSKKVIYANSAFCELIGYSLEELLQMQVYDFVCHSKENVDERMNDVRIFGKIKNGERQWKRKDGKIIDILVSSVYHKNEAEIVYVAAQDISERKIAEENLVMSNRELETFIYKASHDIRGPLASIMGLVNVSKLELKDELPQKYLGMIDQAAAKLDYTLSELVKAMKMKDVKQFSDDIDFDLMVREVLNKFSHYLGFSRMSLHVKVNMSQKYYSSRTVLETILQNLIENSIKYQNIKSDHPELYIDIQGDEGGIKINIEDNGIGIHESIQPLVFDMYFRGNESSKGSGLGLYLVKKGVEKLKGRIDLKSEAGKGTQFTIQLPAGYQAA